MSFSQVIYLSVILILVLAGGYVLYKKQIELLRLGKKQYQQLNNITHQVESLSYVERQFSTPQYLAEFTVTLSNARSTVLRLGDIVYVSVEKKTLQIHTKNKTFTMEGKLSDVVKEDNPLLPFPLFVRVQKSYIINVMYVIENPAGSVYLDKMNDKGLPLKIPLSQHFRKKYMEAFYYRENKKLKNSQVLGGKKEI